MEITENDTHIYKCFFDCQVTEQLTDEASWATTKTMNYNYLSHHAKVFNYISFRWKSDKQVKFWHLNRLLRQHWQVSFLSLPESMTSFYKQLHVRELN